MTDIAFQHGQLRRHAEGYFEGVLRRTYVGHDRSAVWQALTDPAIFKDWLAPGSMDLRQGGQVKIDFADSGIVIDSVIQEFEPERVIAWSWSHGNEVERPLRWLLNTVNDGAELVLELRLPAGEDAAKACAGFEGHLEMLAARLEGIPVKFPLDLYLAARKAYSALLEA